MRNFIMPAHLKYIGKSDNIALNILVWIFDGVPNSRLSSQMDNTIDFVALEDFTQPLQITEVVKKKMKFPMLLTALP
jgi:hypothetical protein